MSYQKLGRQLSAESDGISYGTGALMTARSSWHSWPCYSDSVCDCVMRVTLGLKSSPWCAKWLEMAVCSSGAVGSAEWEDCLRQVVWSTRLGDILRTARGRLLRGHQWFPLVPATWFCAIVHPAYCCGTRRYLEYPVWPVLQGLVLPIDRGESQHCRCSEAHLCFRRSKGSPAWSHCAQLPMPVPLQMSPCPSCLT